MPEFDGELMKAIRRVQGQEARLPDVQRLPTVGSDQGRIQESINGRQDQLNRDQLLEEIMGKRKDTQDQFREGRSAGTQVTKLLTQKLQTRINKSGIMQRLQGFGPAPPGGIERRPNQLF